ncbi:Detected protein of confused Function [Hibiscus syriacus]|uniref:Detected protein of confused Function n=1 Tax=Hibiscus syriacus TaxID=106335 RepID=A0A6A3AF67_HIBSY|nr:norbelladine synthase-like [Hibiscus syriacus]KAE8703241.1 Detected protein of confused Function [Hibiscus syriacus]
MLKQASFTFFLVFSCCMRAESQELKHLTNELQVNVAANRVWELYRHLGISRLTAQNLQNVIRDVQVLEGDGGVGTMLKLTFALGNSSYTERFMEVDDEKRVKVAKGLEGGCLAIGCSVQIVRFDIIEKSSDSCIIRSDISYSVKEEFEANDPKPNIQLLAAAAHIAKTFLESSETSASL